MGAVALGLLIFLPMTSQASMTAILSVTDTIIPQFEGFSSVPYWDVSRYSWGYGTPAPGPVGTISMEQALTDANNVIRDNYQYLLPKITRNLNANQWAALLSFAYNEGEGNADNLIDDINAGDDSVLEIHWKKYIYANHIIDQDLVDRRSKEWQIWLS